METQERVLGWWRRKHAPVKPKRKAFTPRAQDTVDPSARAFWGL